MACLVSINVCASPPSPNPPIQGLDTTRLDGGKSLFQTKWSTGWTLAKEDCSSKHLHKLINFQSFIHVTGRLLMANHWNRGIANMNRENDHCIIRSTTHFPLHISSDSDTGSHCTKMSLSGFWVGPGVEDGWGFVEAIVYRTY
ncbi:hypothetical protein DM860_007368 [Cuscuta australis]|uniref:Uncharacterized protein n=1 Tax=Cuscuta australis TaxID=267555 RepID=A0A328E510_9ASTE|nr:hypothetical protein DM860_007368 [Cuscuta australis]